MISLKRGLIILIVIGFLLITTGGIGGIIANNDGKDRVEPTVKNSEYSNGRERDNQDDVQYNRRTSNHRMRMMGSANYNGKNQCPYVN